MYFPCLASVNFAYWTEMQKSFKNTCLSNQSLPLKMLDSFSTPPEEISLNPRRRHLEETPQGIYKKQWKTLQCNWLKSNKRKYPLAVRFLFPSHEVVLGSQRTKINANIFCSILEEHVWVSSWENCTHDFKQLFSPARRLLFKRIVLNWAGLSRLIRKKSPEGLNLICDWKQYRSTKGYSIWDPEGGGHSDV